MYASDDRGAMTNHHDLTSISIAAAGLDRAPVIALEGEEEIGRPARFSVTFTAPREIDASAVGARARLVAGGRVIGGVIADIESGDAPYGEPIFRVTLVPWAALLAQGRSSRVFERLAAPDIIAAVVAASGLELHVESRLRDSYPVRLATVQHRESDLAFITRLAERDGIALRFEDDGERASIALTDANADLPDSGYLTHFAGIRRRSRLVPRRVELVSADPARPELPLVAEEIVTPAGRGDLQIHDLPFSTPEEGARAARLYAEWLRSSATVITGQTSLPLAAGRRAHVGDHALLVVSARHCLSPDGVWDTHFTAIPGETPYRPERRAGGPRAYGLMGGRLSPRAPGEAHLHDGEGRYRVREAAGGVERIMPVASGSAIERDLTEGAEVVWGCIEGDPERPVITAVLPGGPGGKERGRAVLRGPGGSMFEVSGVAAPGLGEAEGRVDPSRAVPAVAHHSTTTEDNSTTTGTTDTWMRFAVPHTDKSWSYLRLGEAAIDTSVSATSGETFSESADKTTSLSLNSFDADGLAGVFDFTDKNRTELTKGNYEMIAGGQGRISICGDNYLLRVKSDRAEESLKTPWYSFVNGASLTTINGFSMQNVVGTKIETAVGGRLEANIGLLSSLTMGYKLDAVFADSYELRKGEELSDASTLDKRASSKIQFSIHPGAGGLGWDALLGVASLAAATGFGATAAVEDWDAGITTAAVATPLIAALALARYKSKERELTDGNPILSLDSEEGIAALRSDDWLLMMSPSWAVLGKNQPYKSEPGILGQTEVADLDYKKSGTALIIEEGGKMTLQAGRANYDSDGKYVPNTTWAKILLDGKKVVITADEVTIGTATSGGKAKLTIDGGVEIGGDLTVSGKVTVTGASTFKDTITGPNNAVVAQK